MKENNKSHCVAFHVTLEEEEEEVERSFTFWLLL